MKISKLPTTVLNQWLTSMWSQRAAPDTLALAYRDIPAIVIRDLFDNTYCTVYQGSDLNECFAHNARRSVVHEILVNRDMALHPTKYQQLDAEVKDVDVRLTNGSI